MVKRFFLLILGFVILSSFSFVYASSGSVTDISFDISSRPYYMSEHPTITGYVRNIGSDSFSGYVEIHVTAPDGTIYDYTSSTFTASPNVLHSFPITFASLPSEGIGRYDVQVEFWKYNPLWFDSILSSNTNLFHVVFNVPSGNQQYLVDDNLHHPSDPYIMDWATVALSVGGRTISFMVKKTILVLFQEN